MRFSASFRPVATRVRILPLKGCKWGFDDFFIGGADLDKRWKNTI